MNLAVFDIDGTLLDNLAAEDECFLGALRAGLGVRTLSSAWGTYQHVSDQGVAVEAYQREFGSPPAAHLLADTIDRFVIALGVAHDANPLTPIRGAIELLQALPNHGWAVALATGAWRRAAEFKLAGAGIDAAGLPIATSEDGPSRVEIVTTAIARAKRHYDAAFLRTVAVGDGVWDVATARTLALPFVGIASGARADRLRRAGAQSVLPDFVNAGSVVSALETATVPSAPLSNDR
jgi:phosphoglycolate phosphatase-like HAD superfamily hydrolase